jgi:hypothetical protein
MQTYSLKQITDKIIREKGTLKRDDFENELTQIWILCSS